MLVGSALGASPEPPSRAYRLRRRVRFARAPPIRRRSPAAGHGPTSEGLMSNEEGFPTASSSSSRSSERWPRPAAHGRVLGLADAALARARGPSGPRPELIVPRRAPCPVETRGLNGPLLPRSETPPVWLCSRLVDTSASHDQPPRRAAGALARACSRCGMLSRARSSIASSARSPSAAATTRSPSPRARARSARGSKRYSRGTCRVAVPALTGRGRRIPVRGAPFRCLVDVSAHEWNVEALPSDVDAGDRDR